MKLRELSILIIVGIVAVSAAIGFFSAKIVGKDDQPIEEAAEEVIKLETGMDVDLTPGSPEKK